MAFVTGQIKALKDHRLQLLTQLCQATATSQETLQLIRIQPKNPVRFHQGGAKSSQNPNLTQLHRRHWERHWSRNKESQNH